MQDKCCGVRRGATWDARSGDGLPIIVDTMVAPDLLDWRGVARVMSERPAEIVGLTDQGRPIAVGEPANLALVDPDRSWEVVVTELASKSQNTPYAGMTILRDRVVATVLRGRITPTRRRGVLLSEPGHLVFNIVFIALVPGFLLFIGWLLWLFFTGRQRR